MLYVVDKTTSEIVKAVGKPERSVPHSGSEGDQEIMEGLMVNDRLPRWQSGFVIALLSVLSWAALIGLSELVIRAVELLL